MFSTTITNVTTAHGLDLTDVQSSYLEHAFGEVFYALVRAHRSKCIVELGTFQGYSGLHMAAGLRDNQISGSELHLIDLWDEYPYRHCSLQSTQQKFEKNQLLATEYLRTCFHNLNAFEAQAEFETAAIDLLHIDISNDGKSLQQALSLWHDKLCASALLLIEGGSAERDEINWMVKYDKQPIRQFLNSDWFRDRYEFMTLQPFPSLTIARKLT